MVHEYNTYTKLHIPKMERITIKVKGLVPSSKMPRELLNQVFQTVDYGQKCIDLKLAEPANLLWFGRFNPKL